MNKAIGLVFVFMLMATSALALDCSQFDYESKIVTPENVTYGVTDRASWLVEGLVASPTVGCRVYALTTREIFEIMKRTTYTVETYGPATILIQTGTADPLNAVNMRYVKSLPSRYDDMSTHSSSTQNTQLPIEVIVNETEENETVCQEVETCSTELVCQSEETCAEPVCHKEKTSCKTWDYKEVCRWERGHKECHDEKTYCEHWNYETICALPVCTMTPVCENVTSCNTETVCGLV